MSIDPATRDRLRALLLDADGLVRLVATGRRRGHELAWRRLELRYVDLASGRRLQRTTYDETQAHTANHTQPTEIVEETLGLPFAQWHVETTVEVHQVRVSRKGEASWHTQTREQSVLPDRGHDQGKRRLLPPDAPVLRELGIADERGRIKPSRQGKYRQVEELLRVLDTTLADARRSGALTEPDAGRPLKVVDLGCGNAYLTFAAHAWLSEREPVRVLGVDVKEQSREHNAEVAERLGVADEVSFAVAGIADVDPGERPDVVLALHACDTATDDALARAVEWDAPVVLAAPCCHHDVSAQVRRADPPPGYRAMVRDGILRERFCDTLTDALRAAILRGRGYRVEVVEFVESRHTPRNSLLRAVLTGRGQAPGEREELDRLVADWQLRPRLAVLLGDR